MQSLQDVLLCESVAPIPDLTMETNDALFQGKSLCIEPMTLSSAQSFLVAALSEYAATSLSNQDGTTDEIAMKSTGGGRRDRASATALVIPFYIVWYSGDPSTSRMTCVGSLSRNVALSGGADFSGRCEW
jgi:hypothetical protein